MGKEDESRDAILDEALAAATELGMEALSIGDLAKRTGLSKSGLYAHIARCSRRRPGALPTA